MPSAQRTSSTTGPAHLKCAAMSLIVSKEFEVGQRYEEPGLRALRRRRMFCHGVTSCSAHRASHQVAV
jgi:hypothetical protein